MKHSLPLAQFSAIGWRLAGPVTHMRCSARSQGAFTLIELLIVVALIAVLAGLTLSTLGYVNRKGAESRARTEVAAISAAIDAYKLEFGIYPSSNSLVSELTGRGSLNTNRVFFEGMQSVITNNRFIDPWGSPYNYSTNPSNNVGFFDFWTSNNAPTNESLWIRN